jgi:CheY-like chemotaxis protein
MNPDEKSFDDVLERALDHGAALPLSDRLKPISTYRDSKYNRQRIVPVVSRENKAGELAGVHVLVIDDDPIALDMMQAALHYVGGLVTAVPSAKRAFQTLNRVAPDVIVCDLRMPEKDGVTFARELQTMPSLRSIPILAVTAYDEAYVRRDLKAVGFRGFLRKPITFPELVNAVATLAFVGGAGAGAA